MCMNRGDSMNGDIYLGIILVHTVPKTTKLDGVTKVGQWDRGKKKYKEYLHKETVKEEKCVIYVLGQ